MYIQILMIRQVFVRCQPRKRGTSEAGSEVRQQERNDDLTDEVNNWKEHCKNNRKNPQIAFSERRAAQIMKSTRKGRLIYCKGLGS